MNALNALVFASFGALMEILPRAFPSWFPAAGADQESARALWLAFMGAVQISVGLGFIVRSHVFPLGYRILSMVPRESGVLALPTPRVATLR